MKRRHFMAVLGGATAASALAHATRAQTPAPTAAQSANVPLVGFLNSASAATYRFNADAFREGLARAGFVEGRNVRIEERWANSDYQALPALAAELVAKGVVAIAATGDVVSARAAKGASATIGDWRQARATAARSRAGVLRVPIRSCSPAASRS